VLPFRLVAALRQQMDGAHQIAGAEILRIDPGQMRHVLVFGAQRYLDTFDAFLRHVVQQAADEIADQVDAQSPARAEIAENPDHVGHAGKHYAAIGAGAALGAGPFKRPGFGHGGASFRGVSPKA
jgi:hypothetical protein